MSFNQLHAADHSRVKQQLFCALEDKQIPRNEIVKGYEYEKDKYVVIDEDDLKKAIPATAKTMEILEFVKSEQVDAVYFESSYYMAPDDAGEKPYALLFEALKRSGYVGIAKLTMHSREHIVIVRPGKRGMLLHTMYYEDEVRKVEEFRTDTSMVKDKELDLAMTLIQSLEAEFDPVKYKDSYRENVMAMIQAKVQGKQVVAAPEAQHLAPVVDIMEALKASLAAGKKPVRSVASDTSESTGSSSGKAKRARKTAAGD